MLANYSSLCKTLTMALCLFAILVPQTCWQSACFGQVAAPRLVYPVGDYRVGKALLFDGRVQAASHAFETSYRLSRTLGERHGIDAVPTLCRNGQALYLSGDLTGALANANAGLTLAYNCQYWTAYIDHLPVILRAVELSDGRIAWIEERRVSRLANYPEAWPVTIGAQAVLVETSKPDATLLLSYEPIWIDAIEVFYSQAMALRLRNTILGKLAQHYDLSKQLHSMYSESRSNVPELLQRCQNVCFGITCHSLGQNDRARAALIQNLTLDSGFDHPLTGIALLELATIAAEELDYSEASLRAGQASLFSARLGQGDVLADSLQLLARVSDAIQPGSGLPIIEDISSWSESRFGLVYATALASAIESASISHNTAAESAYFRRFERLGRNNQIELPHLEASVMLSQIRNRLASGNPAAARNLLYQLTRITSGTNTRPSLLPQAIQVAEIQSSLREGRVRAQLLFERLANTAARPSKNEWVTAPWQSIVWDNLPLNEIYRQLAVNTFRDSDPNKSIQFVAQWHARQLRIADPLDHRLYAIRRQLLASPDMLPDVEKQDLQRFQARLGDLRTQKASIDQLWELFQASVANNGQNWTTEQYRQWQQLLQLSAGYHKELAFAASLPLAIPGEDSDLAPINFEHLKTSIGEGEAILGLFYGTTQTAAYLITRDGNSFWTIDEPRLTELLRNRLLASSAAFATSQELWQSLDKAAQWQVDSRELAASLIPADIVMKMSRISKLKVIPDANMWTLPFEMLITDGGDRVQDCWIAEREISYALSLKTAGLAPTISGPNKVLLTRNNFYVSENAVDDQLRRNVASSLPQDNLLVVSLDKDAANNFQYGLLKGDSICVGSELVVNPNGRAEARASKGKTVAIVPAELAEIETPESLIFLGNSPETVGIMRKDFRPTLNWLIYHRNAGTSQILFRQWNASGESTATFAQEFLSRSTDSYESAYRSSILNLWEFDFNTQQEPRFSTTSRRPEPRLLDGDLPLFWGGWKLVTNSPLDAWKRDAEVDKQD